MVLMNREIKKQCIDHAIIYTKYVIVVDKDQCVDCQRDVLSR